MDFETNPTEPHLLSSLAWHWGVPLIALGAMAALVTVGDNVVLFFLMNRAMAPLGDAFWSHLTILGDTTIAILFMLPFINRRPDLIWQFILAALLATLWVHGLKDPMSIVRPPGALPPGSFHIIGPALHHNAFPSGHTTTIFVLAGLFCMQRITSWIKVLVLLLAILVGLSRIACGVHWPLDVLGGAFGGWIAAMIGIWVGQFWRVGLNIWVQRAFALVGTLLAIWSLWFYDNTYPGTGLLQFAISACCLALSAPGQMQLFKGRS